MPKNIELKVRCTAENLAEIERCLRRLTSGALSLLHQVDHYYAVPGGRLKMRWIDGNDAELIRYHRPDVTGARLSAYERIALPVETGVELDRVLTDSLGRIARVDKTRTVGVLGRTRVHLDTVVGLGCFVELETMLDDGADDELAGRAEYENVVKLLGLHAFEPIAGSYSDLILEGAFDA
jgi:predicted adenylyl cyclase CyaB